MRRRCVLGRLGVVGPSSNVQDLPDEVISMDRMSHGPLDCPSSAPIQFVAFFGPSGPIRGGRNHFATMIKGRNQKVGGRKSLRMGELGIRGDWIRTSDLLTPS